MNFEIVHIDETDSTNRWLRQHGKGDMVVVADYQTAGRGCGTNTWESERGKNLTFSVLLHPKEIPANRQFLISEAVSVALCETLDVWLKNETEGRKGVMVKWPNDIYVGDRKICGILIENRLQGNYITDSIVGIGLNVNQTVFVSNAPNPVSLRQLTGREEDREALLVLFLRKLSLRLADNDTSAEYRRRLYRGTGLHPFRDRNGLFMGRIAGVLEGGSLEIEDEKGRRRIYAFKEVQFIISHTMARFKRILLKLSGESLMGSQGYGIDPQRLEEYARQIKEVHEMGVEIGIVIGGGNIFRGLSGSQKGFDRVKGDQMGMCATVINSLALSSALDAVGVRNKVLTAIRMEPIGEFYTKWRAIEAMEQGQVCIFSAGTGSPYFTTDTGSSLRGIEIEADVMLKGTRVDGVYTADPEKDPTATKFDAITYKEVLARGLKVMDLTAICMCQDNNLPIYVFNMDVVGNLKRVMMGEDIGTLVHN